MGCNFKCSDIIEIAVAGEGGDSIFSVILFETAFNNNNESGLVAVWFVEFVLSVKKSKKRHDKEW